MDSLMLFDCDAADSVVSIVFMNFWTTRKKTNFRHEQSNKGKKWKQIKKCEQCRTSTTLLNYHHYAGCLFEARGKSSEFRCQRGKLVLFEHYHWDECGACNVIARQHAHESTTMAGKLSQNFPSANHLNFPLARHHNCVSSATRTHTHLDTHQGPVCSRNKFLFFCWFLNLIASRCLGVFVHKLIHPSIDMWTHAFNRSDSNWEAELGCPTKQQCNWNWSGNLRKLLNRHIAYAKWNISDIPVDPKNKKGYRSSDARALRVQLTQLLVNAVLLSLAERILSMEINKQWTL